MKSLFGHLFTTLLILACTPVYAQVIEGTSARQLDTVRNFVKDGGAELYTRGFVLYNDGAVTRPLDGTGGAATVSAVTLTTTTPIRNAKSFLITKAASNVQGQGYSIPFTIDRKDRAKVLNVEIDYNIPSGTFAAGTSSTDSDLVVGVYDVTNAKLIPLSSEKFLSNSSTLEDKFTGSFQSSPDSTSYRLILHHATTSSSAFTFEFEVAVMPTKYVYGTPITDWRVQSGVTINLTNSTLVAYSRRVGDSAEVSIRVTFTGAPGAVSQSTISLPSGLSIDTAKIVGNVVGFGRHEDVGNNRYAVQAIINGSNVLSLRNFVSSGAFVTDSDVTHTSPFTIGNTDLLDINLSFPVVGSSSSVQMSDSADTRVVSEALTTGAGQSIANNASALINLNTLTHSTHGGADFAVNKRINILVSGYYHVVGQIALASGVNEGRITTSVFRNGSTLFQTLGRGNAVGNDSVLTSSTVFLNAGDYLELHVINDIGSTTTVVNGAAATFLVATRVSGPSAIAASESVNARAVNTAGTSIPNTGENLVPFATEDYDSHNSWVTDTFTAPIAGKYRVSAAVGYTSSAYASGNVAYAAIYKNGSPHSYGHNNIPGAVTSAVLVTVTGTVNCLAGDTITIRTTNTRTAGATSLSVSTGINHVSIERAGN